MRRIGTKMGSGAGPYRDSSQLSSNLTDETAALPLDLRKGSALPEACSHTPLFPLGAKAEPSRPAGRLKNAYLPGKPETFRKTGGKAAFCAANRDKLSSRALLFCVLALLCGLALLLPSCGYHEGGRGALIPPDIKTIAVPIFTNQTAQFRIEQQLTAAVTRELIARTSYRVTQNPVEADAVLNGVVKQIQQGVITFNPQTGSATTLQIEVVAGVKLTDLHTRKVVFSNPDYIFREQYQVSPAAPTLIEEGSPALDRLSRDFARTLVTDILENF